MERRLTIAVAAVVLIGGHLATPSWADYSSTPEAGGDAVVSTPLAPASSTMAAVPVEEPSPEKRKPEQKKPEKKKPPAYGPTFYDNHFEYLDDAAPDDIRLGDCWKRLRPCDCVLVDLGGERRWRYHHEDNFRGSRLAGQDDEFMLGRTRLYADVHWGETWRVFAEAVDATSSWEEFAPRNIEENRFDALNLFAEALLVDDGERALRARAGRQELLYGAQRLISPLDWANTRRTFDGAKLWSTGKDWSLDGFWTRPVPFEQHVNNDHNFDNPDQSREFGGAYFTSRHFVDHTVDAYYLRLAEFDATGTAANPFDFDYHTLGGRCMSKWGAWLFEIEGGGQFGDAGDFDHIAGFLTVGAGHEWAEAKWKPVVWVYYDWASGDEDPTDGEHGTFNQLYPLGHKYFGYMDLVARQNIRSLNILLTAEPCPKVKVQAWCYAFWLDERRDSLYNAAGTPIRTSLTGAAGNEVGREIDLLLTLLPTERTELTFGYSHFFAGDFIERTNPAGVSGDADFFYTQATVRF